MTLHSEVLERNMRRVLDRAEQSNKYWETRREWLRRDNDEQRSMATATGALNERTEFHWKWKEHGTYRSEEERRREIEKIREKVISFNII